MQCLYGEGLVGLVTLWNLLAQHCQKKTKNKLASLGSALSIQKQLGAHLLSCVRAMLRAVEKEHDDDDHHLAVD